MEIAMGTTVVAFKIRHGIVLAMDSLGSKFEGGIVTQNYYKLYEINHAMVTAMSGNLNLAEGCLAETKAEWRKGVNYFNHSMTPEEIAQHLHNRLKIVPFYNARINYVNLLVAGFDKNKDASLWRTNGNNYEKFDRIAIGSGGPRAMELLMDENGEYNYEMSKEAAEVFGNRMIQYAARTDEWTGGDAIKVFLIQGDDGVKLLSTNTIENLNWRFKVDESMDETMAE